MAFPYTLPIVFLGTATPLDVAGTIINDAATEMGLSPVDSPYSSTDANFIQLRALLKSLGRDLWRRHTWPALTKVYTFTTSAADGTYPLPPDYGYFIQDTCWNRTTALPAYPLTPSEWQSIKSSATALSISNYFRIQQQQLMLLPDTTMPAGQTVAFEYVSRYWVQALTDTTGPSKTAPDRDDDVLWFDPLLCVRGLKAYFLKAKGLPTAQDAQADFDETLYLSIGDDAVAPVINPTSRSRTILIGEDNLPDTGHWT